jgi:hypothetical protein
MVLRVHRLTTEDAADMICHAVGREHFRTTPESQQAMDDLVLAAEVKAVLVDIEPSVRVWASRGAVRVTAKTHERQLETLRGQLEETAHKVDGVESVAVHIEPPLGSMWML